jgi:hydrogenase-4 component E
MSGALVWLLVGLGLTVVAIRRRSFAAGLLTMQALLLAAVALDEATSRSDVVAAGVLGLRAAALAALFFVVVSRTRETSPVRARVSPLARTGVAVALALALTWLIPTIGLTSRDVERAVLALVAFGIATVIMRRATLFQVMGVVLVENALALAALELPGVSSLVIELGVALDLTLIVLVAAVFHERIFVEFGSGDTAALRTLRD